MRGSGRRPHRGHLGGVRLYGLAMTETLPESTIDRVVLTRLVNAEPGQGDRTQTPPRPNRQPATDPPPLSRPLLATALVGPIAVVIYAIAGNFTDANFWSVASVGIMTSAAALIVGVLVGFLFGLPQTRQQSDSTALLSTSSKLDEVADWLTKILVGLGLVQLGAVAGGVDDLGASVVPALGDGPGAQTLAVSVLVYSAANGFLLGYLWTRIEVSARLKAAADNLAAAQVLSKKPPPPPPSDPVPPALIAQGGSESVTAAGAAGTIPATDSDETVPPESTFAPN